MIDRLEHRAYRPAQSLRVLLCFDWFWKYAANQAGALQRAGATMTLLHRTHLQEFAGDVGERDALVRDVRSAGVNTLAVPGRFGSVRAIPTLVRMDRTIRRWKPDLVHAHDNYDPRLLALSRGRPCVLAVHDPRPHIGAVELQGFRARIRDAWFKRADRFVVHGEALKTELSAVVPPELIAVIPHGTAVLDKPVPVPTQPVILLFGRLEAYKGIDVLLRAIQLVWEERPDVRLVVAGRGPEATKIPADSRIELIDRYIPEKEVNRLLDRATVVVLPYSDGSQSGVGLQAIGRGIPVVATKAGSLPDLLHDPALSVPAGEEEPLAAALVNGLSWDLSTRERVRKHAASHFSWDVIARRTVPLYDELIR